MYANHFVQLHCRQQTNEIFNVFTTKNYMDLFSLMRRQALKNVFMCRDTSKVSKTTNKNHCLLL